MMRSPKVNAQGERGIIAIGCKLLQLLDGKICQEECLMGLLRRYRTPYALFSAPVGIASVMPLAFLEARERIGCICIREDPVYLMLGRRKPFPLEILPVFISYVGIAISRNRESLGMMVKGSSWPGVPLAEHEVPISRFPEDIRICLLYEWRRGEVVEITMVMGIKPSKEGPPRRSA